MQALVQLNNGARVYPHCLTVPRPASPIRIETNLLHSQPLTISVYNRLLVQFYSHEQKIDYIKVQCTVHILWMPDLTCWKLKHNLQISMMWQRLSSVALEAICKWGHNASVKRQPKIFWCASQSHFSLVPPRGAQWLFATDWQTIEVSPIVGSAVCACQWLNYGRGPEGAWRN